MNKVFRRSYLADSIDSKNIYVKCSIPSYKCKSKFHLYNSNGDWNSNRVLYCQNKCKCNLNRIIKIRINNKTKRISIILNKGDYTYSYIEFKRRLCLQLENSDKKLNTEYFH